MDEKNAQLILELNQSAMKNLSLRSPERARMELLQAKNLLKGDIEKSSLARITLNNVACYYTTQKKPNVALMLLNKVIDKTHGKGEAIDYVCNLLNICANLSKLGKHNAALDYAEQAVEVLEKSVNSESSSSFNVMQCVANFNKGAELEFLMKFKEAFSTYGRGIEAAKQCLPNDHKFYLNLMKAQTEVKAKLEKQNQRIAQRRQMRSRQAVSSIRTQGSQFCLSCPKYESITHSNQRSRHHRAPTSNQNRTMEVNRSPSPVISQKEQKFSPPITQLSEYESSLPPLFALKIRDNLLKMNKKCVLQIQRMKDNLMRKTTPAQVKFIKPAKSEERRNNSEIPEPTFYNIPHTELKHTVRTTFCPIRKKKLVEIPPKIINNKEWSLGMDIAYKIQKFL